MIKKSVFAVGAWAMLTLVLVSLFQVLVAVAQAAITEVVPVDPNHVYTFNEILPMIVDFVKNVKGTSPLIIAMVSINIVIALLSSDFLGNWFLNRAPLVKRLIIVVLGQAASIILMISSGIVWYNALLNGLLISGGAILIFECVISLIPNAATSKVVDIIRTILGFFVAKKS